MRLDLSRTEYRAPRGTADRWARRYLSSPVPVRGCYLRRPRPRAGGMLRMRPDPVLAREADSQLPCDTRCRRPSHGVSAPTPPRLRTWFALDHPAVRGSRPDPRGTAGRRDRRVPSTASPLARPTPIQARPKRHNTATRSTLPRATDRPFSAGFAQCEGSAPSQPCGHATSSRPLFAGSEFATVVQPVVLAGMFVPEHLFGHFPRQPSPIHGVHVWIEDHVV